jgi:hypothetical protein
MQTVTSTLIMVATCSSESRSTFNRLRCYLGDILTEPDYPWGKSLLQSLFSAYFRTARKPNPFSRCAHAYWVIAGNCSEVLCPLNGNAVWIGTGFAALRALPGSFRDAV